VRAELAIMTPEPEDESRFALCSRIGADYQPFIASFGPASAVAALYKGRTVLCVNFVSIPTPSVGFPLQLTHRLLPSPGGGFPLAQLRAPPPTDDDRSGTTRHEQTDRHRGDPEWPHDLMVRRQIGMPYPGIDRQLCPP
jgi:hypothetical protein